MILFVQFQLICIVMSSRKYESGASKRKKKLEIENDIRKQAGSLNKFFSKKQKEELVVERKENQVEIAEVVTNKNEAIDMNEINQNEDTIMEFVPISFDISDPVNWKNMNNHLRDLIVQRGPIRDNNINFPKDASNRRFSTIHYFRQLSNGEKHDRKWLIYSKALDRVFCFCCTLFKKEGMMFQLANEGVNDWKNISEKLKTHKVSVDHITNMEKWIELEIRFQKK